jgi:hypothetical protein
MVSCLAFTRLGGSTVKLQEILGSSLHRESRAFQVGGLPDLVIVVSWAFEIHNILPLASNPQYPDEIGALGHFEENTQSVKFYRHDLTRP